MQDDGSELDNRPPVPLVKIANELGFHPSTFRKTVMRRNFVPFQLKQGPRSHTEAAN
jgi:hypothetical protein